MEKKLNKKNISLTIGVLIVFVGICLLSSTYFNNKKNQLFDEMNELYYEQVISLETSIDELVEETTTVVETPNNVTTEKPTTKITVAVNYDKYYIGYLSIPKINFKKGFTAIDSPYNNVNRNIYVVPKSTLPDAQNNNLIIASHSGTSSVSFFKNLYMLSKEDSVFITYNSKEYEYKIKNIYTDFKDGTVSIRRNKNKSTLTLITCTKGDKTTQTIYICELV